MGEYGLKINQTARCDTDDGLAATAARKAAVAFIAAALVLRKVKYVSVFDMVSLLSCLAGIIRQNKIPE